MNRVYHFLDNLKFDFFSMGANSVVPLLTGLAVFVCIFVMDHFQSDISSTRIIVIFECMIPWMASWWSIYLMERIVAMPGCELYFTLPVSRWYYGLWRICIGFMLYSIWISILLIMTKIWIHPQIAVFDLWIQLSLESLFFAFLGFLAMVLIRNIGYSLVAIMIYTLSQILFRGQLFPVINVFVFNRTEIDKVVYLSAVYPRIGLLTLLTGLSAQFVLNEKPVRKRIVKRSSSEYPFAQ